MRISVDIGGTFTDIVVEDADGDVRFYKSPTTPSNPVQGLLDAVGVAAKAFGEDVEQFLGRTDRLVHGTTLATNILVTGRGAKVGLLTTEGFRDVTELRRGIRNLDSAMFDQRRPAYAPLVPRALRIGVPERIVYNGDVSRPLDESAVEAATRRLVADGCDSIAIGFLHSYANPSHELQAKAIVQRCAPDVYVICSHEVLPTRGEFERYSTTVVSAHIGPQVEGYLRRLEEQLQAHGFRGSLLIMLSSGLMQTVDECASRAVELLVSGPAAAPSAALAVAEPLGYTDVLELDMGGTSLDVCVIRNGTVPTTTGAFVGPERIATKMVDVLSLGAGGGSIAWIDSLGLIRVGPQSAGADPGPAAYGRSDVPTVTDADLVLGYLPSEAYLGGQMTVDIARSREAIERLGKQVGLGVEETAEAIFQTVTINMANAVTEVCTKRGHDVRGFAIVAGGGAGGIHAAAIAEHLEVPTVVLPKGAPVLSAVGMLTMDIGQELVKAGVWSRTEVTMEELSETFRSMDETQNETFRRMGIDPSIVQFTRAVELRYEGQFHEVLMDLEEDDLRSGDIADLFAAFHDRYRELYGYALEWRPVEVLQAHQRGSVKQARATAAGSEQASQTLLSDAEIGERRCYIGGSYETVPVYRRDLLGAGHEISGPALIDSPTSTTLLPKAFDARIDAEDNFVMSLRDAVGAPQATRTGAIAG